MGAKEDEACQVLAQGWATESAHGSGCWFVFLRSQHLTTSHSPAPAFVSFCEPYPGFLRDTPVSGEILGAWA